MGVKIYSIKKAKVSDLRPDPENPNVMSETQMGALKKSIGELGYMVPIVATPDGMIIDGQHRWEAAKELGMNVVPVVEVEANGVKKRLIRQVMNKLKGRHDPVLDAREIRKILEEMGDLSGLAELIAESEAALRDLSRMPDSQLIDLESDLPKNDTVEYRFVVDRKHKRKIDDALGRRNREDAFLRLCGVK